MQELDIYSRKWGAESFHMASPVRYGEMSFLGLVWELHFSKRFTFF
jgi:hypothetical protein